MGDGNFTWWAAIGREPDIYTINESTRDACIAAARAEGGDREGFTVVEADNAVPAFDMFSADALIEEWEDDNRDCWMGEGSDPIVAGEAAREDLTRAIGEAFKAWLARHNIERLVTGFGTTRNQEVFPPAAPPIPDAIETIEEPAP